MFERPGENPLIHVHQGMRVFDVDGNEIGTVEHIYLGQKTRPDTDRLSGSMEQVSEELEVEGDRVIVEGFPDILDAHNIPADILDRMLHEGYILVDPNGPLGAIHYILPDQIASVSEEGVHLAP